MADHDYIAYYRVSTDKQGKSGLGLEAQQQAVQDYLGREQGRLVEQYTEVESGKRNHRPQLQTALGACKKQKATLVIAKLDRLARNVHFISGLMESKVDFVAVDNPHANRLMIHLLAAFAEHEREQISQRTKAALAAAKARGVVLGHNGHVLARENRATANAFARQIMPVLEGLRKEGFTTLQAQTDELNRRQVPTPRGEGQWHKPNLHRLYRRLEQLRISPKRRRRRSRRRSTRRQ